MSLSPAEFWKLLRKSNLLPEERVASLQRKIAKKESVANSTSKIVRALVANEILTEEQLRHLISVKNANAQSPSQDQSEVSVSEQSTGKPSSSTGPNTAAVPRVTERPHRKSVASIVVGVTLAIFLVGALITWIVSQPKTQEPKVAESALQQSQATAATNDASHTDSDASPYEFVDSSDALWARPDPGSPIEWRYVPEGTQVSMRVRLAESLQHPEGRKILRSLGPDITSLLQDWMGRVQVEQSTIEKLDFHLLPQGSTMPSVLVVGWIASGTSLESIGQFSKRDANGIVLLSNESVWFPDAEERAFVFGPSSIVSELSKGGGDRETPRFRRELAQLQQATHSTDHVTILANPNFLRDEAQDLFPGQRRRLLHGLFDFWSDEAQAISIGLQLSDVAVVEVRMIAREDLAPRRLAGRVKNFVSKLPTQTGDFLGRARLDPYWQPLALRFPSMLRVLGKQVRIVTEGKQVALNAALPSEAVHNLVLATELSSATPASSADTPALVDRSNWTIEDLLRGKTTIRFAQKSLEQAMNDVAEQVREEFRGVPFDFSIDIIGTDLEPEGITRNQQIRNFVASDMTLREALTQLVMKANPTPGISDPTSPNQKLIWAIGPKTGNIEITTRAAASKKQTAVPEVFEAK